MDTRQYESLLGDTSSLPTISSASNSNDVDEDTFNIYLVNEEIVYTQPTTQISATVISNSVEQSKNFNYHSTVIDCKEEDLVDVSQEFFITEEDFRRGISVSDDVEFSSETLRELDYNHLNSSNLYQCPGCHCIMETEAQFSLHQLNCSQTCIVEKAEITQQLSNKDNKTVSKSKTLHTCYTCGLFFKTMTSLKRHIKTHCQSEELQQSLIKSENIEKPYSCKYCQLKLSRCKALECHIRIHEGEKWQPPPPNIPTTTSTATLPATTKTQKFACNNCGRLFTRQRDIEMHFIKCIQTPKLSIKTKRKTKRSITQLSTSTLTKPNIHPCPQCSKKFSTKQKVFRHMWIHREKAFSCEVCGKSFSKQLELDKHRLSEHAESSLFGCNQCGKSFASRQGLWEHNRMHTNQPNSTYTCTDCGKVFISRQGYLIHNRTHSGERPFHCQYCEKSFRDGGTLRKHKRIHSGERPHKCPLCEKGFNQKVVLREHIRWVHAANKCEYPEPSPYQCVLCFCNGHSDREELCTHIVKHSDQIAAYNKENAKLSPNQRLTTILTSSSESSNNDAAFADMMPPLMNGAKCDRKVIYRNRNILLRYKTLFAQKFGAKNGALSMNNVKNGSKMTISKADEYKCDMCSSSFKNKEYLSKHIAMRHL